MVFYGFYGTATFFIDDKMQCTHLDELCEYEIAYLQSMGVSDDEMPDYLDKHSYMLKARYCTHVCEDYKQCRCVDALDLIVDEYIINVMKEYYEQNRGGVSYE